MALPHYLCWAEALIPVFQSPHSASFISNASNLSSSQFCSFFFSLSLKSKVLHLLGLLWYLCGPGPWEFVSFPWWVFEHLWSLYFRHLRFRKLKHPFAMFTTLGEQEQSGVQRQAYLFPPHTSYFPQAHTTPSLSTHSIFCAFLVLWTLIQSHAYFDLKARLPLQADKN